MLEEKKKNIIIKLSKNLLMSQPILLLLISALKAFIYGNRDFESDWGFYTGQYLSVYFVSFIFSFISLSLFAIDDYKLKKVIYQSSYLALVFMILLDILLTYLDMKTEILIKDYRELGIII